jgi:hypothetical protein
MAVLIFLSLYLMFGSLLFSRHLAPKLDWQLEFNKTLQYVISNDLIGDHAFHEMVKNKKILIVTPHELNSTIALPNLLIPNISPLIRTIGDCKVQLVRIDSLQSVADKTDLWQSAVLCYVESKYSGYSFEFSMFPICPISQKRLVDGKMIFFVDDCASVSIKYVYKFFKWCKGKPLIWFG